MKWVPGYFLFISMFGKLTIYCVLGTFVEITVTYEDIFTAI